jgi:hypothetical protein
MPAQLRYSWVLNSSFGELNPEPIAEVISERYRQAKGTTFLSRIGKLAVLSR